MQHLVGGMGGVGFHGGVTGGAGADGEEDHDAAHADDADAEGQHDLNHIEGMFSFHPGCPRARVDN